MKKIILLGALTIIILTSVGAIYVLNNPNCCSANETKNTKQLNLKLHTSPLDFKKALESGQYKLIDIRTQEEFSMGHLRGASQIDFYQTAAFDEYLNSLDKNGKYLIYCRSGNRSGQALQQMQEKGFISVSDLDGGINAWNSYGFLIEK